VPWRNSRFVIAAGFLLVLALMAALAYVGHTQLDASHRRLERIVGEHNARVDVLHSMRNIAHQRTLGLHAMFFMDEPFERDEEFERFNALVDEFVALRERLAALGLNEAQQGLLAEALALIRRSQPLQADLVHRLLQRQPAGVRAALLDQDLPIEKQILALFDRMIEIERGRVQALEAEAAEAHERTDLLLKALAAAALALGATIAGFVLHRSRRTERALAREKERAEVTLHSIGEGVITTDGAGRVVYLNPAAEQLTGWSAAEAAGRPLAQVYRALHEETRAPVEHPAVNGALEGPAVGLHRHALLASRDGREFTIEDSAAPIRSGGPDGGGAVVVFRDVTDARELARQLSWQASHDPLTGLTNRREFEIILQQLLDSACALGKTHALLYLDLDQFKLVNDTCGHAAGDELLRQLAALLQAEIRGSDTLARLGGDEFGVLLDGCPPDQAERIAQELRAAIEDYRLVWQDKSFRVLASIGLVMLDAASGGVHELLAAADAACYMAKERGRNRVWVHAEGDLDLARRQGEMQWIARLHTALEEDRFALYFQAIRPLGAEGLPELRELLLRLVDENGRVVMPMTFIPAAERYGLMPQIDRWVVARVIARLAAEPAGGPLYTVNLSSQSLGDDHFLGYVVERLEQAGLDPARLCFEITETAAIANWARARRFVTVLRGLGCRFALDDFGSGLSSFAYLKNLPVDYIKIDGAFVRGMAADPMDRAVVETIHRIAHVAGVRTVAEAVEEETMLSRLRDLGVDYAQGYALHRPEPLVPPGRGVAELAVVG
jgi:diguanylate cyclase (GGDEF)-like protein/PAS domain S-box-containing protein